MARTPRKALSKDPKGVEDQITATVTALMQNALIATDKALTAEDYLRASVLQDTITEAERRRAPMHRHVKDGSLTHLNQEKLIGDMRDYMAKNNIPIDDAWLERVTERFENVMQTFSSQVEFWLEFMFGPLCSDYDGKHESCLVCNSYTVFTQALIDYRLAILGLYREVHRRHNAAGKGTD